MSSTSIRLKELENCIPVVAKPVAVVGEADELDEVAVTEWRILVCDLLPVCGVHNLTDLMGMIIIVPEINNVES